MARSIKLKRPKNVKAVAAVSAGLVAFAVLGYLLLVSPQRSQASKLQTQIAAAQQQLATAQAAAAVKPPPDPRVDDLFRLTKAMPAGTDMPGILLELSKVARDTGIAFDSITPGVTQASGSYEKVPIQLSFRGNYYQLSDFLFRLKNLVRDSNGKLDVGGRLYSVDDVDFSQAGTTGTMLSATLSANAFIYGTSTAGATGTTPAPATTPATPATPTTGSAS